MRGGQGGGVRQHVSPRTVIKILQIAAIWAAAAGSTAYVDAMIGGDARPPMCVVIRTFWGHGEAGNGGEGSLRKLLTTLREQTNPKWVFYGRHPTLGIPVWAAREAIPADMVIITAFCYATAVGRRSLLSWTASHSGICIISYRATKMSGSGYTLNG
jgi:hypothetical protein